MFKTKKTCNFILLNFTIIEATIFRPIQATINIELNKKSSIECIILNSVLYRYL